MSKQDKYTRSAKNKECQIRIPGYCNFNIKTTVLCHLNGAGTGLKNLNIHAAYGCNNCHDVVDGRVNTEFDKETKLLWFLEAVIRTQIIMVKEGVLKIENI